MTSVNSDVGVRHAALEDSAAIADIYNYYIAQTIVTFEEQPVDGAEVARRMSEVQAASLPWLVAERNERVVGYAYAAPWKSRFGYRFTVESTIYLGREEAGHGIGGLLYGELFAILRAHGIHSVIGGIGLPNEASVALHEKMGMKKVAELEEVGVKFGRWVNVRYYQLVFERANKG